MHYNVFGVNYFKLLFTFEKEELSFTQIVIRVD